jgi:hypothetical protein
MYISFAISYNEWAEHLPLLVKKKRDPCPPCKRRIFFGRNENVFS